MTREIQQPVVGEDGTERHPAWATIGASRVQNGPPGAVLFDSDVKHMHTVRVRIGTAERKRELHGDRVYSRRAFVEVEMSEAQWASFVSSMNVGDGVACTMRYAAGERMPEMPYDPALAKSMDEVRTAADDAWATVRQAFDAYAQRKTAANLQTLRFAIRNAPANMEFAAKSLTEHSENVVQKARADIEALAVAKARQLGIDPGDFDGPPELLEGGE